ncbi:MAG: glycosyltransferase [Oligoflexia bacterium]|nr:glycosyltransferase [Oligoflexia bacterium]
MSKQKKILYLCYDGLNQPIGQSQVLQLLINLSENSQHSFTIISLESNSDLKNIRHRNTAQKLKEKHIDWHYHAFFYKPKRIATLLNLFKMLLKSIEIVYNKKIDLIHARAFFPTLIAFIIKLLFKTPYIFDMRGFWPDEKADLGAISRTSFLYKLMKKMELMFINHAAATISLSEAAIQEIKTWKHINAKEDRFYRISTNVDLSLFKWNQKIKNAHAPVIGHIGSAHSWYLMDEFFLAAKAILKHSPDSRIKILNRHDHTYIKTLISKHQIPIDKVELKDIEHNLIHEEICSIDLAIFFIKPAYSKIASAPTKFAELLACGVPCLTNEGIGDIAPLIRESKIGVVVQDLKQTAIESAALEILSLLNEPDLSRRATNLAEKEFSMRTGALKYLEIYNKINNIK